MIKDNNISDMLAEWVRYGEGYYGWRHIRYFLFEYEMYLQSNSKAKREKIDWDLFVSENFENDFSSVEHIYPQKAHDQYWTDRFSKYTQTQKNALRNSLGNLLALSKPKNSSLGNKPFSEKRDANPTGYRFGSYSENEVALCDEWTAKEILERGIKMLEFLEKRWKINIGDRDKKSKALGLVFLIEK
ncbi:HNH endonuclease family protein [Treponema endosymbiont of Eucomonympha sp.]|uniref:HNH endonuclease family protein n=1 Tax=Treponema endosymbiont of Eucomonympha sp. TaxID=1580831 RepID=UPI000B05BC6E|nr:HNH endonuclease family protein [Treponema endosymbiont of Eucomonympha sp.]